MNTFFDPVNNTAAVEQLNKELGKDGGRTVLISGCIDTQKVHISSAIASGYKYMLIVTSDEAKARKMCDDASFFNREAIYYPAKDAIFYSADVHGNQITGERLRCISRIINHSSTGEGVLTVVTTMDGIADRLIPVERFKEAEAGKEAGGYGLCAYWNGGGQGTVCNTWWNYRHFLVHR